MIEALWVMTYFKISLPTRNWDIAFFYPLSQLPVENRCYIDKVAHADTP